MVFKLTTMKKLPVGNYHPDFIEMYADWYRWRSVYEGGDKFIDEYLMPLSARESDAEFKERKSITYNPAFAASALDDVKNSIFQRITDVVREGGPSSYSSAVRGEDGGVDFASSSMGTFMGLDVLTELLITGRVGVLVDNFDDLGITLADKGNRRPYVSVFRAENILNWYPSVPVSGLELLLLAENVTVPDEFGFPAQETVQYRMYQKTSSGIVVTIFDEDGNVTWSSVLNLEEIPFALIDTSRSLLTNVDRYQIALMNLESSDIAFARKSNYPFFYEFVSDREYHNYGKEPGLPAADGTAGVAQTSAKREIKTGLTQGRQYPEKVAKPPGFINPSPETLLASMEKGQQMREDIRLLINLNLQNINPRRQAADSKSMDSRSLEAGLSYLGNMLEKCERQVATIWSAFEGSSKIATVAYPKTYVLKSDEERRAEALDLDKLQTKIPSERFRRLVLWKMAKVLLSNEVSESDLKTIHDQIMSSETLVTDPNILLSSHKSGLVSDVTASTAIGFDGEKEIPIANEERIERASRIVAAQGGNASPDRGVPEMDKGVPSTEKDGKQKRGKEDNSDMGAEQK